MVMLTFDTDELRRLMEDYPEHKIAILCSEDVTSEWPWTYASNVSFSVGELLDTDGPCDNTYTDRDDLEDDIACMLDDMEDDLSDEEFQSLVNEKMREFEPFWKPVIFIWADI